jgi:selenocysteine lyase/cysteine desulfurase
VDTRYIAVSAVQYSSGYLADLRALRALCDEHNLYLLVDATQAVGTVPVDVRDFAPDIMTFSSYKWLCAGYGVAALYVSPQLLDSKPLPAVGWRSANNAYGLANHDATMSTQAYALELGNPVMPGPLVLGASVAFLAQIGLDAIGQRIGELTDRLHTALDARGIAIHTPRDTARRAGITMMEVGDAAKAEKNLNSQRIHVSARAGLIRVSTHLYNNEDDIDALLQALD